MASQSTSTDVPTVSISFDQLTDRTTAAVKSTKSAAGGGGDHHHDDGKGSRRKPKRPEMAIYVPKHRKKVDESSENTVTEKVERVSLCESDNTTDPSSIRSNASTEDSISVDGAKGLRHSQAKQPKRKQAKHSIGKSKITAETTPKTEITVVESESTTDRKVSDDSQLSTADEPYKDFRGTINNKQSQSDRSQRGGRNAFHGESGTSRDGHRPNSRTIPYGKDQAHRKYENFDKSVPKGSITSRSTHEAEQLGDVESHQMRKCSVEGNKRNRGPGASSGRGGRSTRGGRQDMYSRKPEETGAASVRNDLPNTSTRKDYPSRTGKKGPRYSTMRDNPDQKQDSTDKNMCDDQSDSASNYPRGKISRSSEFTNSNRGKRGDHRSQGEHVEKNCRADDVADKMVDMHINAKKKLDNSSDSHRNREDRPRKPEHKETKKQRDSFKNDSRLYDPNAKPQPSQDKPVIRGGLIQLPTSESDLPLTSSVHKPSATSSRGGTLYNPEDPENPMSIPSDTQFRSAMDSMYISPAAMMSGMSFPAMMPMMNMPGGPMPFHYEPYQEQDQDYYHQTEENREEKEEKSRVNTLLKEVKDLDRELHSFTSRRMENHTMDRLNRIRKAIQEKLEWVIVNSSEYSSEKNLDQLLWKSVYHTVLESLKRDMKEEDEEDAIETQRVINNLLSEAQKFYLSILKKLEKLHHFDLSTYTCLHSLTVSSKSLKLVLVMCQRILICLGDVARYQTQSRGDHNYGASRSYYLQASHVAPKNGKPYNQLAIIALYAKRKLDTVFYFTRSILSTNAFLSAKESLHGLFHEISKKYEQTRQVKERVKSDKQRKNQHNQDPFSNYKRIEVWISKDGTRSTDQVDDVDDADNPRTMPCKELYSKMMNSFLVSQGMIFTKIGMERFPDVSSEFLHQLIAFLEHSPITYLDTFKLIQMFSICMFSVQQASGVPVAQSDDAETCRSYTQEQAMQFSLDFFTVIMQRCCVRLSELIRAKVPSPLKADEDLNILLPVLKLFSDWMNTHRHVWNPPPMPRDPALGPVLDNWAALAEFANILCRLDLSSIEFVDDDCEEREIIYPREDYELAGYLPLMSVCRQTRYVHPGVDKVEACQFNRVKKLTTFCDFLCGIEPSMLEYDRDTLQYISVVQPPSLSEQTPSVRAALDSDEDDPEAGLEDEESEDEGISGVTGEVSELRRNRRHLRQQLARQQREDNAKQALFEREGHMLKITVCPTFLVPDTNCFIEYLTAMKRLIESQKFTVVVPLVVINEIDGLSKTAQPEKYGDEEHGLQVRREASLAFEFLDKQFENGNKYLKALTMAGTELKSLSFRSEESTQIGTNDDKILSCCLHYCKDNARDFMPKQRDNTISLSRDVVLLTDDRNLRLKAHTRNVPVRDTMAFVKWAKIG